MRPAARFWARIAVASVWPTATTLAVGMQLFSSAFAQTPYTIPANTMPWQWTAGGLNSDYQFGVNDGAPPVVIDVSGAQGQMVTVTYQSGTVYPGCCNFYYSDANGNTNTPTNNGKGASGTYFPSYYMSPYPIYLVELVGTFADSSGAIVGTPFALGDGPTSETVPQGATQLQLGVNDDIFSDNQGSWQVSVMVGSGNPCSGSGNQPAICFNGEDIAGSSTPTQVAVGQQIVLQAYPSSGHWVTPVDGNPIAGFYPTATSCEPETCTPPADFSQPMATFYWDAPSDSLVTVSQRELPKSNTRADSGRTSNVEYTFQNPDGSPGTLTAKFKVVAPNFVATGLSAGQVYLLSGPLEHRVVAKQPPPAIAIGCGAHGFSAFSAHFCNLFSAYATDLMVPLGEFEFAQLLKTYSYSYNTINGPRSYTNAVGSDGKFPYPSFGVKDGQVTMDFPNVNLLDGCSLGIKVDFEASTYLLWTPGTQNSIFVPLGRFEWGWSGAAHRPNVNEIWTQDALSVTGTKNFYPGSSYPYWSQVVTALGTQCP